MRRNRVPDQMKSRDDTAPPETAAQAIERVLRAERDAGASVELARAQARTLQESAREDALAIVNRSMERVARWQHAHGKALDQRLRALRDAAVASPGAQHRLEESALAAAVDQVAELLTTANDGGAHDDAP